MKCLSYTRKLMCVVVCCVSSLVLLLDPGNCFAASDEFFPELKIGTHVYKNVTVTTRAKEYIFILHSGGMGNIKIAELPDEIREKLGYAVSGKSKSAANKAESWVRKSAAGQAIQRNVAQSIDSKQFQQKLQGMLNPSVLIAVLVGGLLLYLFYCYCGMLICEKAGAPAGALIWLPLVQIIPMLRAARMSPLWFVGLLVPVLNIVTHIVWSVNIVKARSKSGLVTLGLVLPITSIFAFLYLAFSGGEAKSKTAVRPRPEIMTLETA